MPPTAPRIAAAAHGSTRWSRSNSPRRAARSKSRTAARPQSDRPESEDQAWRPLRGPALYLFDHDRVDLIGNVVETIGDFLEMIVDFGADDEIHGVGAAMLEEELLEANVVQIVDRALQLGQFLGDRRQHRDIA